ncbi:hypothetical protein HY639_03605 [Candidatus Woesearchaeota archaeon]|nr:hypothetical protein [Candidatus Woesearchaeota archaeon]
MKKELLTLALLVSPALAQDNILELRARENPTPRKTEHFMQYHYRNFQDATPLALNATEDFLATGFGDEKEMVNAAADMMRKSGYNVTKMYYKTQSGIERYAAYVQDPPQQNNYLLHLEWHTDLYPVSYPEYVVGPHGQVYIIQRTTWRQRTYIAPTLRTGLGSVTSAKMYLQQHGPVAVWGTFEYDTAKADGMNKVQE